MADQVKSVGTDSAAEYSVLIDGLTKRFGDFVAVDQINLNVRKGEVFGFLGRMAPANPPPFACCAAC